MQKNTPPGYKYLKYVFDKHADSGIRRMGRAVRPAITLSRGRTKPLGTSKKDAGGTDVETTKDLWDAHFGDKNPGSVKSVEDTAPTPPKDNTGTENSNISKP